MASIVSICNEALGEIGADTIASLEEASVSATECRRAYADVVTDLLSRGEWGFLIRRVPGAYAPSDRPAEWSYAYAKPDNATRVIRVLPKGDVHYPEWGAYSTPFWDGYGPVPFVEEAGIVRTNVPEAIIEYRLGSADVSEFPPLFRRAVAMELAARIAMPIKKDRQVKGDAIQQAEVSLKRALAEDHNRYPRQQQDYVSQAELARAGAFG